MSCFYVQAHLWSAAEIAESDRREYDRHDEVRHYEVPDRVSDKDPSNPHHLRFSTPMSALGFRHDTSMRVVIVSASQLAASGQRTGSEATRTSTW